MKCKYYGSFEHKEDGRVIPLDLPAMSGIPKNMEMPDWLAEEFVLRRKDFGNALGEKHANDLCN